MTSSDRQEQLRAWYRQALGQRAAVLETLVPGVGEGGAEPVAEARSLARSLAGSGATFGFPEVSEAARMVEVAERDGLLPRVVGLLDVLRQVSARGGPARHRAGRWLVFAAGPLPDPPEGGAVPPDLELDEAWGRVARRLDATPEDVARRIGDRLGIEVADPGAVDPSARLVVPPALALEYRVLPLRDDGVRLVAGSANPTDVLAMAALDRATGRSVALQVLAPASLDAALRETYRGVGTDGPPDHGAPAPVPDGGTPVGGDRTGPTVLVVDDEPGDRLLCRCALEDAGFRVREAPDGAEALSVLEGDARIDALVLDVLMPGMDGRELLRAVRSHPRRKQLPVVVLTGLEASGTEVRLLEAGADDYLRKPVDPRVLAARVEACLRRRGAVPTP